MNILHAAESDYEYIAAKDRHVLTDLIASKIRDKEIYILRTDEGKNIGWLRYGYFWDNLPFMNLLWIDEAYRGKGIGKQAVQHWEEEMKDKGCNLVMTSTMANEGSQHFYRKLGYKDNGCLLLENEPLEIMLTKSI